MDPRPEPMLRMATHEPTWFNDLTVEDIEFPDDPAEHSRMIEQLGGTRAEIIRALGGRHVVHTNGEATIDLACDTDLRLLHAKFTYVDNTGEPHERRLTRIIITPSSVWISEADRPLSGWLLDKATYALEDWRVAALGKELHDRMVAAQWYAEEIDALSMDLGYPAGELERKARHAAADLGALLFTEPGTPRRMLASEIAKTWNGTIAEMLALVDDVLAPPTSP